MTKVGFLKELNSGDAIILPGQGRAPLQFAGTIQLNGTSGAAFDENKVLHALLASRTRGSKD